MIDFLPKLESNRLILSQISEKDISNEYISWLNDKDVNRFLGFNGDYTVNMLENYVENLIVNKTYFWTIKIKDTNKHIGNIKIDPIDFNNGFAELGIIIGAKEVWGKGYAKEAINIVLDYCFNNIKIRKINLGVLSENFAAVKLYLKIGFEIEGTLKYQVKFDNKYIDTIKMAIFNPAFPRG
jgi:[ribosomal protein S5]-alanine N-acetyltransferase